MRKVKLAIVQMMCEKDSETNIKKALEFVEKAAQNKANFVLLPELFENIYFCQEKKYENYKMAKAVEESKTILKLQNAAEKLNIVIPVSFYEKDINVLYNSVAIIDAGGEILGVYRKTHIPDDHFYQEKFYFTPGNSGFKVWNTKFGKIGVGICWDQWFPECARAMAIMGAEIIFYPTAIGSEPILDCDSMKHWQRCMQGHSAANIVPIAAANRIGEERVYPTTENNMQKSSILFYGSSFITNETGEIVCQASRDKEEILYYEIDLDNVRDMRMSWGLFRDRRPECYMDIVKETPYNSKA